MTYAEIATRARGLARMSTSGTTDAQMWPIITMIYNQFAVDVHGLPSQDYIEVAAKFFPRTHFGFHLEIVGSTNNDIDSDIALTDADANGNTGTEMATELQLQIRTAIGAGADLTVAWANFYFTVDGIDSTTLAITAPDAEETYTDYVSELFGGVLSGTDSVTGGFPEGCTSEQDLPADAITVNTVMWEEYELAGDINPAIFSQQTGEGDPIYYRIRGKKLYLSPPPSEQKKLYIDYKRLPSITGTIAGTTDITEIPTSFHRAICYGVAAMLLDDSFEDALAYVRRKEYDAGVKQYLCDYYNANTNTGDKKPDRLWYGVAE